MRSCTGTSRCRHETAQSTSHSSCNRRQDKNLVRGVHEVQWNVAKLLKNGEILKKKRQHWLYCTEQCLQYIHLQEDGSYFILLESRFWNVFFPSLQEILLKSLSVLFTLFCVVDHCKLFIAKIPRKAVVFVRSVRQGSLIQVIPLCFDKNPSWQLPG